MARFRGTVLGNRGEASRLGSPSSGLRVTADGWDGGITVHLWVDSDGVDQYMVTLDGGSGGVGGTHLLVAGVLDNARYEEVLNGDMG